jgi:polysaccharide export outer membrane protein
VTLVGCSFLPNFGPSIQAVRDGATGAEGGYSLVELNAHAEAALETAPPLSLVGLGRAASSARDDLIGVGDALNVTVLEREPEALYGVNGFSNATLSANLGLDRTGTSTVPKIMVDSAGTVAIPYAGEVRVAGLTTTQAAQAIQISLKGKAIDPQVVVTIADNVANSVTVVGEVHSPGRYSLSPGSDHLLDMLALAAGATRYAGDIRVEIVRGSMTASASLADVLSDSNQNIKLAPRDQIRLVYSPRKFSVFGAFIHATEFPIEDESVTLAQAVSRAGGLDPGSANASEVLVFRFERPSIAKALSVRAPVSSKGVPIIYEVDLRNPEELFIANRFEIRSGDLIYVPREALTEVRQFIDVVNAASSVAYNVRVTAAVVP